ncbi:hypothetical protein NDU88_008782 [Pleurodeles waltl]|uniref:Uncharacterized protein n=1 Tax=Pleurodeles waltl TaxID=8319 RepID=A0AAV7PU32_PLEWA|nr:hypothetical protein NDU88_008782 [Pleurodeles waltl]
MRELRALTDLPPQSGVHMARWRRLPRIPSRPGPARLLISRDPRQQVPPVVPTSHPGAAALRRQPVEGGAPSEASHSRFPKPWRERGGEEGGRGQGPAASPPPPQSMSPPPPHTRLTHRSYGRDLRRLLNKKDGGRSSSAGVGSSAASHPGSSQVSASRGHPEWVPPLPPSVDATGAPLRRAAASPKWGASSQKMAAAAPQRSRLPGSRVSRPLGRTRCR